MDAPDNEIGPAGAAALVEGLKEMTNLKELNLYGEYCMDGIVCEVAVMSWIKHRLLAGVCVCARVCVCTRCNGQWGKGNSDACGCGQRVLILWLRGHGYLVCKQCLVWHAWRCKCVVQ